MFRNPNLILAILVLAALLGAWLLHQRLRTTADLMRLHLEGRNRLLEKFGTAQEFLDFTRTRAAEALLPPRLGRDHPGLRLLQAGVVCLLVGGAFLYQAHRWQALQTLLQAQRGQDLRMSNFIRDTYTQYAMNTSQWGLVWLAFGVGLLAGGAVEWTWVKRRP